MAQRRKQPADEMVAEIGKLLDQMARSEGAGASAGAVVGIPDDAARGLLGMERGQAIAALCEMLPQNIYDRLLARIRRRRMGRRDRAADLVAVRLPRNLVAVLEDIATVIVTRSRLYAKADPSSIIRDGANVSISAAFESVLETYLEENAPMLMDVAIHATTSVHKNCRMLLLEAVAALPETASKGHVRKTLRSTMRQCCGNASDKEIEAALNKFVEFKQRF